MRVLGLWSFFHKYYGVLHQNLEYLLFIFSIIYNLKRHRKIFLLIWLLLSFVITQTETPPKALPLIFQCTDWHKSQNEAQNLAHKKKRKKNLAHDEKLREMKNCVCSVENKIKTFKSWLFDKFFFKVGFAFRGRAAAQHETVINIGDIVSICVYY